MLAWNGYNEQVPSTGLSLPCPVSAKNTLPDA